MLLVLAAFDDAVVVGTAIIFNDVTTVLVII